MPGQQDRAHRPGRHGRSSARCGATGQAGDDNLLKMAVRIKSRAMRRCGQLMEEYNKGVGRPEKNGAGAGPISQRAAAEQAGMSKRQEKTARRLSNIPEDEFEAAVESDDPPSPPPCDGV